MHEMVRAANTMALTNETMKPPENFGALSSSLKQGVLLSS
jgi:hypothetical protein